MASELTMLNPTLLDLRSRMDPDNKIAAIIEMLAKTNPILEDMVMAEGNLPTGHRTTVRTGLPSVYWRTLNKGVKPSKSRTAQVDEGCGMLEAYAEVDKVLADLNGNTASFRLSEDRAFIEAMNQEMARGLFYGNPEVEPEKFLGLAPRFAAASTDETQSGYNIVKPAGSVTPSGADQTSIWLVVWGINTVHGIYPKGSEAGLKHQDLGEVTLGDATNGYYQGYRAHYKWDLGLVVRDWRYVVRVANIDMGSITSDPATQGLLDAMDDAISRIPSLSMGRPVFYARREVMSLLTKQARKGTSATLRVADLAENRQVTMFNEVAIKRTDGILKTEAVVA